MRFKRELTKEDLQAIQERGADSPDVRALLWEVARLRALALRTHDYFRQGSSSTSMILTDSLRTMLEAESVILGAAEAVAQAVLFELAEMNVHKGLQGCGGELDSTGRRA